MFKKKSKSVSFGTNTENVNEITEKIHEDKVRLVQYLSTKDILCTQFVNWNKNRDPDKIRVLEISKYYIEENVILVPGTISCYINSDNKYVVFDGIHRILGAYEVYTPMNFILCINKSNVESEIVSDFLNINKSINIPSIYLENENIVKKLVCEKAAKKMCELYPSFVSPSRKPFVYNFNRDNLVEFISTLDIDFNKKDIEKLIVERLLSLNTLALQHVSKHQIVYPKKCQQYNFYLFYLDKSIIAKKVTKYIVLHS